MAPRFTFKEPKATTSKNAPTKMDNIGGVLYEAVRKSNVRNPRFKVAFIASIPASKNYSNAVQSMLKHYELRGHLKCECCGADDVYFKMHKENARVTFKPFVDTTNHGTQQMTVDHNLLKSLGGENNFLNYTPLCKRCNTIRGSRFAEYKEFKEWYDAQEFIDTIAGLPDANFCYIDYEMNLNNPCHFNNIKNSSVLPPVRTKAMLKNMRQAQYSPFTHLKIKEWLALNRTYANNLLNDMVYERTYHCLNVRLPKGEHDFFSGCTSADHRKIMFFIEQQVQSQIRKRVNEQRDINNLARSVRSEEKALAKEAKKIPEVDFSFKGLFVKIAKMFA